MTKKKIGSSCVRHGKADEYFTLPENLPKGVYQLIAEYLGTAVYSPSFDIKKLIIGWASEIIGVNSEYHIDNSTRELTITGTLYGYDDEGNKSILNGRNIYFTIVDRKNPTGASDIVRYYDGDSLKTGDDKIYAVTDNNGRFSFTCKIPSRFNQWHYQVLVVFEGDDDYVTCIETTELYIGWAPVYVGIECSPSEHIKNDGACILETYVLLQEDVDDLGLEKAKKNKLVQSGLVVFKESINSKDWVTLNIDPAHVDNDHKMEEVNLNEDGIVQQRYSFNYDEDSTSERYVMAKYSGSDTLGYKSGSSRIIHIVIDKNGDTSDVIRATISGMDSRNEAIFMVKDESRTIPVTLDYGLESSPVPAGVLNLKIQPRES